MTRRSGLGLGAGACEVGDGSRLRQFDVRDAGFLKPLHQFFARAAGTEDAHDAAADPAQAVTQRSATQHRAAADASAGPNDASQLPHRPMRIGETMQAREGQDQIELAVGELQVVDVGLGSFDLDAHLAGFVLGPLQHGRGNICGDVAHREVARHVAQDNAAAARKVQYCSAIVEPLELGLGGAVNQRQIRIHAQAPHESTEPGVVGDLVVDLGPRVVAFPRSTGIPLPRATGVASHGMNVEHVGLSGCDDWHMEIPFATSQRSTIGIEWELALVDADSGDLRQVADHVIAEVAPAFGEQHPHIRQELLLNTVEVVSGVADTVGAAGADLQRNIDLLRPILDPLRVDLMSAGTHPFSRWDHQKVTDKERYATLIDRTQWWGRQMLIYGVHVHVGIEDRDKVMPISAAMLSYYGHLQALSASSPFWGGSDTGYASNRALMFQQLPTAGLPFHFQEWAELEHYVDDLTKTGVIDVFDEIRWDLRPSPKFGTLEVRVCDGIPTMSELMSTSALTQCLVEYFSSELDAGRSLPNIPPWFAQENKWRSARYGMDAILILDENAEEELVTTDLVSLLRRLEPVADRLGCSEELGGIHDIIATGASYQRQRAVAAANDGQLDAVVASLVEEMRTGRPVLPKA